MSFGYWLLVGIVVWYAVGCVVSLWLAAMVRARDTRRGCVESRIRPGRDSTEPRAARRAG